MQALVLMIATIVGLALIGAIYMGGYDEGYEAGKKAQRAADEAARRALARSLAARGEEPPTDRCDCDLCRPHADVLLELQNRPPVCPN